MVIFSMEVLTRSKLNKLLSHLAGIFWFVFVFLVWDFCLFVFLKNNVSLAYLFGERLLSDRVLQMKPLLIHQWRGAEQPRGSSLSPLPAFPCLLNCAALCFCAWCGHCHRLGLHLMMGGSTCQLTVTEFIFMGFCSFFTIALYDKDTCSLQIWLGDFIFCEAETADILGCVCNPVLWGIK